ncbi:MAG: signal peptide peptidase SppA [Planctomycetota bacterium]
MDTMQPRSRPARPASFFLAWFLAFLLFISGGLNVLLFFFAVSAVVGAGGGSHDGLMEVEVSGEGARKILVLPIHGPIMQATATPLGITPDMVDYVRRVLRRAREDSEVAGILLDVNSPGGGVTASDQIYHLLSDFKDDTDLPIVALFGDVAASGGYYVSMAADEIWANPTTITGSIGVILSFVNLSGLLERYDVEEVQITPKDTPLKGMGSMFSPLKPEERAVLENIVEAMYERFVEIVDRGRSNLPLADVRKLADGSIYSAEVARANGLVDQVGYREAALKRLLERANIERARVVEYRRQPSFRDLLLSKLSDDTAVEISLTPEVPATEGPVVQYLWPGWRR